MIEFKQVHFHYTADGKNYPILKGFDFQINRGEFVAIKGPSGSGKSTLLYLMAGLISPNNGQVKVLNQDLQTLRDYELSCLRNKEMGFIFQQFHLLAHLSIRENILLGRGLPFEKKLSKSESIDEEQKLNEIASTLQIKELLDKKPNQLSGGQQQRVAIARALMQEANILLADEPTGNLDSVNAKQTMEIFRKLHASGKTIVLITHDEEVAESCPRIVHFRDGVITHESKGKQVKELKQDLLKNESSPKISINKKVSTLRLLLRLWPAIWPGIKGKKLRAFLTMLGIVVGITSLCSLLTLGEFIREKTLDSYETLGVNTFQFRGHPNWSLRSDPSIRNFFWSFDYEKEVIGLKKIFPSIRAVATFNGDRAEFFHAGKAYESKKTIIYGSNEQYLEVSGRKLDHGNGIALHHFDTGANVCLIGFKVHRDLFEGHSLGKYLHIKNEGSNSTCRVIGVLAMKENKNEWYDENEMIVVPHSFFKLIVDHHWSANIHNFGVQLRPGEDLNKVSSSIKAFFVQKYGETGYFSVHKDALILEQMQRFLGLFNILMGTMGIIALSVGGISISNLMFVTVNERLREIGLKRALGTTKKSVFYSFIIESFFLCFVAGIIGLVCAVALYQSGIYFTAKMVDKIEFEWFIKPMPMILSFVSLIIVGMLSGLAPALKARKIEVLQALRTE